MKGNCDVNFIEHEIKYLYTNFITKYAEKSARKYDGISWKTAQMKEILEHNEFKYQFDCIWIDLSVFVNLWVGLVI